ncbi:conserved hypothetical protein [Paenibacillus curdlanolyticus YK9]|uniref:Uncharacterized protein n=1 Tax=Paenibacillus curdlanolyticus YK9 TaxID=717606 RepID=E0I3U6_9BACL|nr:hypothetical protein [Paenibacillus curdlanolyticus]EFM12960.1 conserved hypothetical protein [Paenibacillus curdlanolyticus YK9]
MEKFEDLDRKPRTGLFVAFFSWLCGICLMLFATVNGPIRFVFSLLALVIVIRSFGKIDKVAPRVWFIVLAIVWYLLLTIIVTIATYDPPPAAS